MTRQCNNCFYYFCDEEKYKEQNSVNLTNWLELPLLLLVEYFSADLKALDIFP